MCADADATEDFHSAVKAASAQFTAGQYDVALKQFRALEVKGADGGTTPSAAVEYCALLGTVGTSFWKLVFEDYERSVGDWFVPVERRLRSRPCSLWSLDPLQCHAGDRTARIPA